MPIEKTDHAQPDDSAPSAAEALADSYAAQVIAWRSRCSFWITTLVMSNPRPLGFVYAATRALGALVGRTEQLAIHAGDDAGTVFTVTIQAKERILSAEEQEAMRVRAEAAVRTLYDQTGIPIGSWPALAEAVGKRKDLIKWLVGQGLLPARPQRPATPLAITDAERMALAEENAERMAG